MDAQEFLTQRFAYVSLAMTAEAKHRRGEATYEQTMEGLRWCLRNAPTKNEREGVLAVWSGVKK
jgi:thiamine pyrophosphokinase